MAIVADDPVVTINGTDLSAYISSIQINVEAADLDATTFASGGWRERVGGLKDGSVTINFKGDYASGTVDATLWPLLGATTTITAKPDGGSVSATNPLFSGSYLINELRPIEGSVGELVEFSLTWPSSGEITRATS